jgi:hypothetical protein
VVLAAVVLAVLGQQLAQQGRQTLAVAVVAGGLPVWGVVVLLVAPVS